LTRLFVDRVDNGGQLLNRTSNANTGRKLLNLPVTLGTEQPLPDFYRARLPATVTNCDRRVSEVRHDWPPGRSPNKIFDKTISVYLIEQPPMTSFSQTSILILAK
jgi:hypothetical protein